MFFLPVTVREAFLDAPLDVVPREVGIVRTGGPPFSFKAYRLRVPRSSRSLFCAAKGGRAQPFNFTTPLRPSA